MNSTDEITTPPPATFDDCSTVVVARIRISLPEMLRRFPAYHGLPEHNHAGTNLLKAAIDAALGFPVGRTGSIGCLNKSTFTVSTPIADVSNTLCKILAVLRLVPLDGWASLAWFDKREDVWRIVHTGAEFHSPEPLTIESLTVESQQFVDDSALRLAVLKHLQSSCQAVEQPAAAAPAPENPS